MQEFSAILFHKNDINFCKTFFGGYPIIKNDKDEKMIKCCQVSYHKKLAKGFNKDTCIAFSEASKQTKNEASIFMSTHINHLKVVSTGATAI